MLALSLFLLCTAVVGINSQIVVHSSLSPDDIDQMVDYEERLILLLNRIVDDISETISPDAIQNSRDSPWTNRQNGVSTRQSINIVADSIKEVLHELAGKVRKLGDDINQEIAVLSPQQRQAKGKSFYSSYSQSNSIPFSSSSSSVTSFYRPSYTSSSMYYGSSGAMFRQGDGDNESVEPNARASSAGSANASARSRQINPDAEYILSERQINPNDEFKYRAGKDNSDSHAASYRHNNVNSNLANYRRSNAERYRHSIANSNSANYRQSNADSDLDKDEK